jgi:hypothetical protein
MLLAAALLSLQAVWGLAPLLRQAETVDRVHNGEEQRSYIVLFNEKGPSFGMNKEKLQGWLQSTVGAEPENVQHIYEITENFRGYALWANISTMQAIKEQEGTLWVEEDSIVRATQSWTTRPDWGQIRVSQAGAGNLATTPSGFYSNGTYPSGSATTWDWQTGPYNNWRGLRNQGANAKIWIVDTGVLQSHQEFARSGGGSRVTTSQDYVGTGGTDCNGHGSHCAGSAAGNYRGVAPAADIGNVRVLNCQGSGTNANVIAGFNFVSSNQKSGASNILSASLGGGFSESSNAAIRNGAANGVIPVVAAGNDNANACNYSPASTAEAVTVGAITAVNNGRASFTNTGSCVDVFAPGVNIHSAWYTSATTYNTISGTSMATPLTAGAIAIYCSIGTAPVRAPTVKTAINNTGSRNFVTGSLLAGTPNIIINANW